MSTWQQAQTEIGQERQKPNRWYYRCMACLGVWAIEPDDPERYISILADQKYDPAYMKECPYCKEPKNSILGIIEMGRVQMDTKRIVKDGISSVCNALCTHAWGPLCVCHCGGANHGKGLVIRVTKDAGGEEWAVEQSEASKKYGEKFGRQAEEFRAAYEAARTHVAGRLAVITVKMQEAQYDWNTRYALHNQGYALRKMLRKAKDSKMHKSRMKLLKDLLMV